jgi:hypothetical protein
MAQVILEPTFSCINTLTILRPSYSSYLPAYEGGTECSETSAYKIQTPGNYPEESIRHSYWLLLLSNERLKGKQFYIAICRHRLILFSVYISVANFDWVKNAGIRNALRIVHRKQRLESSELLKSLYPISFL